MSWLMSDTGLKTKQDAILHSTVDFALSITKQALLFPRKYHVTKIEVYCKQLLRLLSTGCRELVKKSMDTDAILAPLP